MAEWRTILEACRMAGVAPPVGTEARQMSRVEFDRLSEERHRPRGDSDARRGLAEGVARPTLAHEWRADETRVFARALLRERVNLTGALQIEWRGSAPEPDASFYSTSCVGYADDAPEDEPGLEPAAEVVVAPGFAEACRAEEGLAPPPPVVDIDRGSSPARAAEKCADSLEMGVPEIWTWRPREGATTGRRRRDGAEETVPESGVLPGVRREDLEPLRADAGWGEGVRRRSAIVGRILERVGTDEARG